MKAAGAKSAQTQNGKYRRATTAAGALYIAGTAAGMGAMVTKGYFSSPDYMVKVSENACPVIVGALFVLIMGLSLSMMSVLLYPVLKNYSQTLATGYVLFRGALETTAYIVTASCWLLSVALGQSAGGNQPVLASMAAALTDPRAGTLITGIFFIAGALMFYTLLYRSRLVPRWISAWGLAAALPYLVSGLLVLFGTIGSGSDAECILILPMLVQEMVLAVWLIVKGFRAEVTRMVNSSI